MERQFDQFDRMILDAFNADPLEGVPYKTLDAKFHPTPVTDRIGQLIQAELVASISALRGRLTDKGQAVLKKSKPTDFPKPEGVKIPAGPETAVNPGKTERTPGGTRPVSQPPAGAAALAAAAGA